MGRKANPVRTAQITFSTTEEVKRYLESLVATGVYGRNVSEAASMLVSQQLREIIGDDAIRNRLVQLDP